MRIKFLSVILSFLLMSIAISSCLNSDDNYEYSSDATIRAFGIDTIGKGIYYKFTIDQLKREIYNVDSLPVGADTIIDKILIDTLTTSGIYITSGLNDTVFNMSDSVDLREPIKLKVHAADGITTREYIIKVNVHKQDPDSLIWREMSSLPSPISGRQRSVILKENLLVYTSPTTAYRSPISNPAKLQWESITVNNLPDDAKLTSIVNFNDQLYITTRSGEALQSADGINWTTVDGMQDMRMVTFIAGIPGDNVTGNKKALAGIFTGEDGNYFCTRNVNETEWVKGTDIVPFDFPLDNIYSTVFTNASGIKQTVIVGNIARPRADEEIATTTVPWFSMDGQDWVDMSSPSEACPGMSNPSIMYYGGYFYMMGGTFESIYSARVGIAWYETGKKFRYATEKTVVPGKDEDDKDIETVTYKNLFKDKGDYSLTIDEKNYIWIVWNDGTVWRGRQNKLGFKVQ